MGKKAREGNCQEPCGSADPEVKAGETETRGNAEMAQTEGIHSALFFNTCPSYVV